jgi:hypothetical protein
MSRLPAPQISRNVVRVDKKLQTLHTTARTPVSFQSSLQPTNSVTYFRGKLVGCVVRFVLHAIWQSAVVIV